MQPTGLSHYRSEVGNVSRYGTPWVVRSMIKSGQAWRALPVLAGILVVLGGSSYTLASEADQDELTALKSKGYQVVAQTMAKGEFVGCEFNLPVELQNGMIFVCLGDQRGRAYKPDVTILRDDNGDTKVLIDGVEYRGTLHRE